MQTEQVRKRNRDDMEYEMRYSIRLLTRHITLARNADIFLNAINLIGLTGAVSAIVKSSPTIATVTGVIFALTGIAQFLLKPAERRIEAKVSRKRYTDLWSDWNTLDDNQVNARLAKLHGDDIDEISGLCEVAELETCQELGLMTDHIKLSTWNKILRFCS